MNYTVGNNGEVLKEPCVTVTQRRTEQFHQKNERKMNGKIM